MADKKKKIINLALQGGGAHGAFTWGILDKLLESDLFIIEGISSTSAGSMNGVILAQGMINGGNQGARDLLQQFWRMMSEAGTASGVTAPSPLDPFFEPILKAPLNFYMFNYITSVLSPYQFNPSNVHPIREVLEKIVDIEKIKAESKIDLYICATNVRTGKIRIFEKNELSINAMIASACLPKIFQAVEIDNEHYWDGGYLGNPAIFPLIYHSKSPDIIIAHTVPINREIIPTTVPEIEHRLREISFNSSLMREMRAIAFVSKMKDDGWLKDEYADKLRKIYLHCIRADKSLEEFPLSTVYTPDWNFLTKLRDLGRREAEIWIETYSSCIGNKGTIDFSEWL